MISFSVECLFASFTLFAIEVFVFFLPMYRSCYILAIMILASSLLLRSYSMFFLGLCFWCCCRGGGIPFLGGDEAIIF